MIRYIFGISIITLIIIALRFLLKERISKKLQYMLWLAVPLVCIDSENKKAIMAILNTDGTDQVYFQMDVVLCEDYAYDCDIVYQEKTYRIWGDSEDDLRQKDMFYGVKYGG